MKPRLFKRSGLWFCAMFFAPSAQLVGIGYTPLQAYQDWERQP